MLMTVLRGELAVKQSRALVQTFKHMKDYILENDGLLKQRKQLESLAVDGVVVRLMENEELVLL